MSWRDTLRPASFRGARFHVDAAGQASGRRVAMYEYPKRDDPGSEDMGRRARRHQITAYVVGESYHRERDLLIAALERDEPGLLILPTLGEQNVRCEVFNVAERRERGGFVEIDCVFVEAGEAASVRKTEDTQAAVRAAADRASEEAAKALDAALARGEKASI